MNFNKILIVSLILCVLQVKFVHAKGTGFYQIRQGDVLAISVWGDETLMKEIRVLPDGHISFPLAGLIKVAGRSSLEVERNITKKLKKYLPDPVVNVIVQSTEGNKVYILGKVTTPGTIPLQGPMTVLQALSITGGFDRFADLDEIKIIRGNKILEIHYKDLIRGRNLKSNYVLQADDTILVP